MSSTKKIPTTEEINSFRQELKDLLMRYNAEIGLELDGDIHCVSSCIYIDIYNTEIMRFSDGISQYDLK